MLGEADLTLSLPGAFALLYALTGGAGLAFGRSLWRRVVAWCLAGLAPFVTWLAPGPPIVRFLLAMAGMLAVFHMVDLTRDLRSWSAVERVWLMVTPFDTRRVRRVRPALRARLVIGAILWGVIAAGTFAAYLLLPHPRDWLPRHLARWSLGLICFYSLVELLGVTLTQGYLLVGLETPALHRHPALARSVRELWAERWNLEVARWLRFHLFLPCARRRRPTLGILVAFTGSTALHVWIMLPSQGWAMAGLWATYFMVQAAIVITERRLRVARWPAPLAHTWTVVMMVLPAPLFLEPLMRVFPG